MPFSNVCSVTLNRQVLEELGVPERLEVRDHLLLGPVVVRDELALGRQALRQLDPVEVGVVVHRRGVALPVEAELENPDERGRPGGRQGGRGPTTPRTAAGRFGNPPGGTARCARCASGGRTGRETPRRVVCEETWSSWPFVAQAPESAAASGRCGNTLVYRIYDEWRRQDGRAGPKNPPHVRETRKGAGPRSVQRPRDDRQAGRHRGRPRPRRRAGCRGSTPRTADPRHTAESPAAADEHRRSGPYR